MFTRSRIASTATSTAVRQALLMVWFVSAMGAAPVGADLAPTTPTFQLKWGSQGSAPGQFNLASGVAVDALGNVYVADIDNHRVQKFDFLGNFITQWGTLGAGPGQFNQPNFVAVDASGNVYVTDFLNDRVQKFTSNGVFLSQWGSSGSGDGQFNHPHTIAVDGSGNIYVTEWDGNRVQKFTSAGVYVTQWGSLGSGDGQFHFPAGIAVDKAGYVYVADYANDRVEKFTSAGGYVSQWGSSGSGNGQFHGPGGVALDAVGNLYVADYSGHRVQKFTADGTYLTQWGSLGAADGQFTGPWGLAVDAAGNVYVGDWDDNRIQKFSGAGVPVAQGPPALLLGWGSTGVGNGQFISSRGAATDAAGNVYVADTGNNRIQKFSSSGAYLGQWGSTGTGNGQFNSPYGVATDPAGNVYVVENTGFRVQKFNASGAYLGQWGSFGAGDGQFTFPEGIATDAAGNVYVSDTGANRIEKFSGSGIFLTKWGSAGSGNGQFSTPKGVATDAAGNVYVGDFGNHRVQKFTSDGTFVTQMIGDGHLTSPSGVATDAAGNVYVSDVAYSHVVKLTSIGTQLLQWNSSSPVGVTTDGASHVYVVGSNSISKFVDGAPVIALVSDIGNDQGGQVKLRVLHSSQDALGSNLPVTGYEVYRRDDPLAPPATSTSAASFHVEAEPPAGTAPARAELAGWTYLGTFPAHGESEYNVVAPTLENSNAASLYYTAFMVRAATASPYTFFDSGAEYGYSVDNLSPPAPTPFTAAYAGGATYLHWGVSSASDFASFKLYKGSSSSFTPGVGSLVVATTDTGYVDGGAGGSYYKLSAVDLNGNESPYALVGPGQTASVPGEGPLVFALEEMRPNPATTHALMVRFSLPGSAEAELDLLDVSGRSVVSREVGALGVGPHMVNLAEGARIHPGLYFVRLRQGANRRTVRVTVLG